MNYRIKQNGLTLIELMIVVAIIGVLAGIAYPSYQDSIRKSRRAEAHTGLFALQMAMEKARGNCATYPSGIDTANSCANSKVGFTDQSDYYNFSISGASASAYTLVATAVGSQADDTDCAKITLNRAGVGDGSSGASCW